MRKPPTYFDLQRYVMKRRIVPGFYLVRVMGSEQAGLTGFKGSIVRRVAVSHSVKGMQVSLAATKSALEHR